MADATKNVRAITLDWRFDDGMIVVAPRDEDRFVIRFRDAVEILHRVDKEKKFKNQFDLLLKQLASWLKGRRDLSNAYVTIRDGALAFVVIRESTEYDSDFEDELSELDVQIANDPDLDLVTLNTMALPAISEGAAESFLDKRFTLAYAHAE